MKPWGYHLAGVPAARPRDGGPVRPRTVRLLKLAAPDSGIGGAAALRWSAGIAALLFALHPLRVEGPWLGFRANTMCSPPCSSWISIWSYLKAFESRDSRALASRLAGGLARHYASPCFRSPSASPCPAVLLILDEYLCRCRGDGGPLDSICGPVWMEKLPFLILAGLGGAGGGTGASGGQDAHSRDSTRRDAAFFWRLSTARLSIFGRR